MSGYDPSTAPRFEWPKRLTEAKAKILKAARLRSEKAQEPPKRSK